MVDVTKFEFIRTTKITSIWKHTLHIYYNQTKKLKKKRKENRNTTHINYISAAENLCTVYSRHHTHALMYIKVSNFPFYSFFVCLNCFDCHWGLKKELMGICSIYISFLTSSVLRFVFHLLYLLSLSYNITHLKIQMFVSFLFSSGVKGTWKYGKKLLLFICLL